MQGSDGEDWLQLASPGNCTAVGIEARIAFPVAFEGVSLAVHDPSGATIASASACGPRDPEAGSIELCLATTITPGASYGVQVARSGEGTCGGACTYNRYTLTVRLATP